MEPPIYIELVPQQFPRPMSLRILSSRPSTSQLLLNKPLIIGQAIASLSSDHSRASHRDPGHINKIHTPSHISSHYHDPAIRDIYDPCGPSPPSALITAGWTWLGICWKKLCDTTIFTTQHLIGNLRPARACGIDPMSVNRDS